MLPGQCGPGSDGYEWLSCIPQSDSITGASPSGCLVSYTGQSLGGGSYPSADIHSVYSAALDERATKYEGLFQIFTQKSPSHQVSF